MRFVIVICIVVRCVRVGIWFWVCLIKGKGYDGWWCLRGWRWRLRWDYYCWWRVIRWIVLWEVWCWVGSSVFLWCWRWRRLFWGLCGGGRFKDYNRRRWCLRLYLWLGSCIVLWGVGWEIRRGVRSWVLRDRKWKWDNYWGWWGWCNERGRWGL